MKKMDVEISVIAAGGEGATAGRAENAGRTARRSVPTKNLCEPLRLMMGINEKLRHIQLDQMIEREGDERFLKDGHQRLGEIVGERAEACPESGAEDKGLSDLRHQIKQLPMAEEIVWRGTSSQWKNFGRYSLAIVGCIVVLLLFATASHAASPQVRAFSPFILLLLLVPILLALLRYLELKTKVYELTTERIKISAGI